MSNSYECAVSGLYSNIFIDIRKALPSVSGLDKDESRLLSTIKHRGLRFTTLDLPAFGKHFDKCLSERRLTVSNIPNFGMKPNRVRSLRFLKGLLLRVFDDNGVLRSQPCVTSIFFIRQLCHAVRKIKIDCSENVRERTLQRYFDQELSLPEPTLNWVGSSFDSHRSLHLRIDDVCYGDRGGGIGKLSPISSKRLCDIVHDIADRLFSSWGHFDPLEWRAKHGPGAVSDRPVDRFKYTFPTWSERLELVFPYADLAFANYHEWADTLAHSVPAISVETPCIALTVPKSQKAPRIIAKEPTAAMWCQQMVRDYLESNAELSVLRHCVSFNDQSKNGNLALSASATGSHWTIDLSDASDRMSLWLIERLARSNTSLLRALQSSRSVYCEVPMAGGSKLLRMKKFAPQGSATTFPLQTIVYAILAIASVHHARNYGPVTRSSMIECAKAVQVFGDDSIVPSDAGELYCDLLRYSGFTVNDSKTYGSGKFRESCGVEAYEGEDVTPSYFTKPYTESDPSSVAGVIECSNNFFRKGLWHTAEYLQSTLPRWIQKYLRVVGPDDGRLGLYSFIGTRETTERRFNRMLMREEAKVLTIKPVTPRRQPNGSGHLLQYFTEKPTQDIKWMSGVDDRSSTRVRKSWEPTSYAAR